MIAKGEFSVTTFPNFSSVLRRLSLVNYSR